VFRSDQIRALCSWRGTVLTPGNSPRLAGNINAPSACAFRAMIPERLSKLSIDFIRTRIGELQQVDLKITCIDDLKLKLAELIDAYASPTITIAEGKSLFVSENTQKTRKTLYWRALMKSTPRLPSLRA